MIESGDAEDVVNPAVEQPGEPAGSDAGLSRRERLRRILLWAIGIGVVVAILGTLKWWGDQQQRAKLHGRSWPPEPVKVFFGR